ncbi:MAG: UvrD-helicase domain-containing protein [Clostridia bacterium]
MDNLLDNLNDEQKVALMQTEGAVLVTAGAGSGKTRLLTHRIAYLINVKNVSPYNILAITFTNKASAEMASRVKQLCPECGDIWISTFHSMCVKILRYNIGKLGGSFDSNFTIYADNDSDKLLKKVLADNSVEDEERKKRAKWHISNCKNNNLDVVEYVKMYSTEPDMDIFYKIFNDYQKNLCLNNALDFDDLLTQTYKLLTDFPEVCNYYASRFKYVLVDEFQDTNKVQLSLIKLLSSVHKNVFVVGDEDQCIYTWRGASFQNIFDFKNHFSNVQVFKLEQNYRSGKKILEKANNLIKNNKSRFNKILWTNQEGGVVEYKEVYDEQKEADYVASTILKLKQTNGYNFNDFAILLRLNALTLPFEEKLLSYNIPHKIFGGFKFFERAEIKNVVAYLRCFVNIKDNVNFGRIANFPKRGFGETSLKNLTELAEKNGQSCLECLKTLIESGKMQSLTKKLLGFIQSYNKIEVQKDLPISMFAELILNEFQIIESYDVSNEQELEKVMNIQQLLKSMQDYQSQNPNSTLVEYLESISLVADIDSMDGSNNVIIATVHAVKGLEFKVVFMIGMEETIFPLGRAQNSTSEMEEERRLAYVAITRAKEQLFLSKCTTRYLYGRRNSMIVSRFVNEIGVITTHKEFCLTSSPISAISNFKHIVETHEITPQKNINRFAVGQVVVHPKFGIGNILSIDEDTAEINFKAFGNKTLLLTIAPLKVLEGVKKL